VSQISEPLLFVLEIVNDGRAFVDARLVQTELPGKPVRLEHLRFDVTGGILQEAVQRGCVALMNDALKASRPTDVGKYYFAEADDMLIAWRSNRVHQLDSHCLRIFNEIFGSVRDHAEHRHGVGLSPEVLLNEFQRIPTQVERFRRERIDETIPHEVVCAASLILGHVTNLQIVFFMRLEGYRCIDRCLNDDCRQLFFAPDDRKIYCRPRCRASIQVTAAL
jgi:hypothetical protein